MLSREILLNIRRLTLGVYNMKDEEYGYLLGALENVLGKGKKKSKSNYAFLCPVCNHKKYKLEVRLQADEQGNNPWSCWVCGVEGTRGKTIHTLLRKVRATPSQIQETLKYTKKGNYTYYREETSVELPDGYIPLYKASKTSITVNRYLRYLTKRGVTDLDIKKYTVGYTTKGTYADRIIFPSYNQDGRLNFFIAKSIDKKSNTYSNPDIDKNIIFYESLINWKQPITLCEGVFDAIAIKRNVVPLLGKALRPLLLQRLIEEETPRVYISVDTDALEAGIRHSEVLTKLGIENYIVELNKEDPSEEGFENMTHLIRTSQEMNFEKILKLKLNAI